MRRVSGVLGGPEKDAGFLASSSHGIMAGLRFVQNSDSLQSFAFGLI